MRGTIVGDVVGSVWEGLGRPPYDFPLLLPDSRFTDDTVCTLAIADALLRGEDFGPVLRRWGRAHPDVGYGSLFEAWLRDPRMEAYQSYGNGGPMRVSACAWYPCADREALRLAHDACAPTHDHPEALAAAQAVVAGIRAAARGGKEALREAVEARLGVAIPDLGELQTATTYDVSAIGTVLSATAAVLGAEDFESALRHAVHVGGDTDTTAAIAGGIAEAIWGVPPDLWKAVSERLTDEMLETIYRYEALRRTKGWVITDAAPCWLKGLAAKLAR